MNVRWIGALSLGFVVTLAAAGAQQPAGAPRTEKETRSYALGYDLGNQLRRVSVEVDQASVARGLRDALAGIETVMTPADAKLVIGQMQAELKARQEEAAKAAIDPKMADANRKAGEAFLAENGKKPGVVTLPSGLQYRVIVKGNGRRPGASDTVICQYRGTLIDGTEFDSSYSRPEPAAFPVNRVIAGWAEALQLMPLGSKWQLFVPAQLAYGERGNSPRIGPNAVLLFELELVAIK